LLLELGDGFVAVGRVVTGVDAAGDLGKVGTAPPIELEELIVAFGYDQDPRASGHRSPDRFTNPLDAVAIVVGLTPPVWPPSQAPLLFEPAPVCLEETSIFSRRNERT
jgi:hypothetical protein